MSAAAVKPIACCVHCRPVESTTSSAALTKTIAAQSRPVILGANESVERYSIFTAEPIEVFEWKDTNNPFEQLQAFLEKYKLERLTDPPSGLPLPGWFGFFSYSLAHHIEKLPYLTTEDLYLPLVYLAFCDKAIVYDHVDGRYFLLALEYAGQRQSVDEKFRQLQSWLQAEPAVKFPVGAQVHRQFTANMTRDAYFDAIRKIKRYIYDGEVYQINFSCRWVCDFTGGGEECFIWQNQYNPSPMAAYLACEDWAVVSASPELFLRIEGDTILTRPIKGTRPRNNQAGDEFNQQQYDALLSSEKERAELMMIVDLERNDIAKVCIPGTRHVQRLRTIDTHPTLFHASADVAGTLLRRNDPALFCDILRATFPGGSITGAPKIRAMEIIEELEPTSRSLYTGCIGHIGVDFNAAFNIAIRTIILQNQKAYFQTGGGIVADSDPEAEWREMLLKAEALHRCLETMA